LKSSPNHIKIISIPTAINQNLFHLGQMNERINIENSRLEIHIRRCLTLATTIFSVAIGSGLSILQQKKGIKDMKIYEEMK
jgi:hypothetical protein